MIFREHRQDLIDDALGSNFTVGGYYRRLEMRFKIFFNEPKGVLDVNCLKDDSNEIILPENTDQHVYYPIPSELTKEIYDDLLSLLDQSITDEFSAINASIKELQQKRKAMIDDVRAKLNPSIIKQCEDFKLNHQEYFI